MTARHCCGSYEFLCEIARQYFETWPAFADVVATVAAGAPFVIVNTIAGGLMAYGLTGLRYAGYAIVLYLVVLCLQALISNQLQIFCVWLTPNQASP